MLSMRTKVTLIDFKKRLSRRDTDERFHLSTAQDEVKIPQSKYEPQCMTTLIHKVRQSMGLCLCCLESLTLLQVWLYSRASKSLSLWDVLALIKHRFQASAYRVNV
jgi:hypothetical protein